MLAFGGVAVDADRPSDAFPSASMLTGLFANALGWDHRDFEALEGLQKRVRHAVLARTGRGFVDYHTADLGQPSLLATEVGWTTGGVVEQRAGGPAKTATHIRTRHYLTDARLLVAVALAAGTPDEDAVLEALRFPARPLFIGRKCCLPSGAPIGWKRLPGDDCVGALLEHRTDEATLFVDGEPPPGWGEISRDLLRGCRDWRNQVQVGARWWRTCRKLGEAA